MEKAAPDGLYNPTANPIILTDLSLIRRVLSDLFHLVFAIQYYLDVKMSAIYLYIKIIE